jgi:hypothetical protein
MFKKFVSEARDAKKNERHVCGRARVGERPVSWRSRRNPSHWPTHRLSEQAFSQLYVEPLSEARTKLACFFNILVEGGVS